MMSKPDQGEDCGCWSGSPEPGLVSEFWMNPAEVFQQRSEVVTDERVATRDQRQHFEMHKKKNKCETRRMVGELSPDPNRTGSQALESVVEERE